MIALAGALKKTSVQWLVLHDNHCGSAGVQALAAALKEASVATLGVARNGIGAEGARALLEGLRDSPVLEVLNLEQCGIDGETCGEIRRVLEANKARSFLLQMEVQTVEEKEIRMKFRTMGGSEAAVLTWSLQSPMEDLPKAVWSSIRSSGLQLPLRDLSLANLKLVRPDGAVLDAGRTSASFAQQLGFSTEP